MLSRRVLITLVVIVLIILAGSALMFKRSLPAARKGDPNNEPPRPTVPAPKK